jgi:hypothetical protein
LKIRACVFALVEEGKRIFFMVRSFFFVGQDQQGAIIGLDDHQAAGFGAGIDPRHNGFIFVVGEFGGCGWQNLHGNLLDWIAVRFPNGIELDCPENITGLALLSMEKII